MPQKSVSIRYILTATLLGNTLEWYDLAAFRFLAHFLAIVFYPSSTEQVILIHTTLFYAYGTVLRPFSGLIFGYIGDKFGRRTVLITTILLLTIPTLLLCILPTYAKIGFSAIVILMVIRMLHSLSAGGELPGVMTFLYESSSKKNRGFYGSFSFFGIALGFFLGALDFFFLNNHLSPEAFISWGWRIMFITGSLIGAIAYLLRRKLHETHLFHEMQRDEKNSYNPLKTLFLNHKKNICKVIGIEILETLGFNLLFTFSSIYYISILNFSRQETLKLNLVFLFFLLLFLPLFGLAASRFSPKRVSFYAAWAFFLFSIPLYALLSFPALRIFFPVLAAFLSAAYAAPLPTIYSELFPTKVRLSGIGIGFNLSIAIFGGFAPYFVLRFIQHTGSNIILPIFLMLGAVISLLTLRRIK